MSIVNTSLYAFTEPKEKSGKLSFSCEEVPEIVILFIHWDPLIIITIYQYPSSS